MTNYPAAPHPDGPQHHDPAAGYGVPGPAPGPNPGSAGAAGYSDLGSNEQPVCSRHPERVSFVRCQRCDQPVCPQCQRQAAVGVHCVDCVRADQRQTRAQRTVLGGRVTASKNPVITQTLIGISVALFLLGYVAPVERELVFAPFLGTEEPWRILTTGFLHAGILHLAMNMYALWIVGPFLERMLGRWRYLGLYFLSLAGGTLAVVLVAGGPSTQAWFTPVVGASGAVFGLFGAIALVLNHTGRNAQQILVVIGINVVISFTLPGISWQAHLGGLLVGALLGLIFTKLPRERQHAGGVIAVIAVAAVIICGFIAVYGLG